MPVTLDDVNATYIVQAPVCFVFTFWLRDAYPFPPQRPLHPYDPVA
jgi:hypothetical protein